MDGTVQQLTSRDGHRLDAYLAKPAGQVRGGVVIAQEMYGVSPYLMSVCDYYAAQGYLTIAPALYDRVERGLVVSYERHDHERAQSLYRNSDWALALDDLDAGREAIAKAGRIGMVGFCWGGSLAWLAACRRTYDCAVAYYGSMMPDHAAEQARCPVIAHIGTEDTTLPADRVQSFIAAQPSVPVYLYEGAGHGFDNESRSNRYQAEACRVARERTIEFLARHIG